MPDNENLGQAIDRLENVMYTIQLPLKPEMHLEQLRKLIPEIVKELKSWFVETTGENPWE